MLVRLFLFRGFRKRPSNQGTPGIDSACGIISQLQELILPAELSTSYRN